MGRWIGVALVALTLAPLAWPALGHAQQADATSVLAASALTEADLPAGLTLVPDRSGPRPSEQGTPTYLATFIGNGTGDPPIMGIVNVLSEDPDTSTSVDRLAERFRTGLGGNPVDLAVPPLGDASRAFTVTNQAMGGAISVSTAFVALRRRDVVTAVAVTSLGAAPQSDLAVRLAQSLDGRLAAALQSGA